MKLNAKAIVWILLGKVLPIIAGLAVLVLVVAWMAGVMETKIQPGQSGGSVGRLDPDQKDSVYEVAEVFKDYTEEAIGTLKAASRTEISARVMAPIERILVRPSQVVAAGDVLIELDRRAFDIQLNKAKTSLQANEALLKRAQSDYDRNGQLLQQRIISQEKMDQIIENLRVSQAKLQQAREAVGEALVKLSYTTLKAPQDGTIVEKLAEEGGMATPGVPLLILYDPKSLRLEVPVMENLAVNLKPGDELTVRIDAVDKRVTAYIDEIVPQAEAASRSFLVKVTLPYSDRLFEGMFGRLIIPVGTRRHLCLHNDAIQTIGQLQFVDVVTLDDTLQRRMIKTGREGDENHREVLSGLKAGERVLKRPQSGTK